MTIMTTTNSRPAGLSATTAGVTCLGHVPDSKEWGRSRCGRGLYARRTKTWASFAALLFAAMLPAKLAALDLDLERVGVFGARSGASAVAVSGHLAFLVGWDSGMQVMDIRDSANPRQLGSYRARGGAEAVAAAGNYAYVAVAYKGLEVVDVTDPSKPRRVGRYDTKGTAGGVAVSGGYVYLATASEGLLVIDVSNPTVPRLVGSVGGLHATGIAVSSSMACLTTESGLQVIDISDPSKPQRSGHCNLPGEHRWPGRVAISGDYALVTSMSSLQIVDIRDPAKPRHIGDFDGLRVDGVAAYADIAYLAAGQAGLQLIDISRPENPRRLGVYQGCGDATSVALFDGRAYVAGSRAALQVIEIANPDNPRLLGPDVPCGSTEDVALSGQTAYLAQGDGGLIVLDISDPARPRHLGNSRTRGFARDVVVSRGFAYVACGEAGLSVIDVRDPAQPWPVASVDSPGIASDVALASDSLVCMADNDGGLLLIDISNPANPVWVGQFPGVVAKAVAVSGQHAYVAAGSASLQVFDIRDAARPQLIGGAECDECDNNNGTPDATGVAVSGNTVCLLYRPGERSPGSVLFDVSNPAIPRFLTRLSGARRVTMAGTRAYFAGGSLRVYDIVTPTGIKTIGLSDSVDARAVALSGSFAYVAAGENGFQVFAIHAANPQFVGGYRDEEFGAINNASISGNYAYLAGDEFQVIDITDPAKLRRIGNAPFRGDDIVLSGNFAFVTGRDEGLQIIDLSDPAKPRGTARYTSSNQPHGVVVSGNYAHLVGAAGVEVIDISNPRQPARLSTYDFGRQTQRVALSGSHAFVTHAIHGGYESVGYESTGLQVFDVGDPAKPMRVGGYADFGFGDIAVAGHYAYVLGDGGLHVLDVSQPANPRGVGYLAVAGETVMLEGHVAYVTGSNGGLQVIDISEPANPRRVAGNSAVGGTATIANGKLFLASGGLTILNLYQPIRFESLVRDGGAVRPQLSGPAGVPARLQRSTDLHTWEDWQSFTFGTEPLTFSDSEAATTLRFYRALAE
ncbi:MAG: hypothetical protein L0Z50_33785 [Verrucomicrobiales bacterium]|nr:hypothetical protein [Verrucomicrobiales bacterium]